MGRAIIEPEYYINVFHTPGSTEPYIEDCVTTKQTAIDDLVGFVEAGCDIDIYDHTICRKGHILQPEDLTDIVMDIVAENKQQEREERAMRRELSSPQLTGRIHA